jgi:hypothetical protein
MADSSSTTARQNVSPGAKSALLRAKGVLQGYAAEDPRIAALIEKLGAIESPQDDGGAELAKRYERCVELSKSEDATVREAAAAASFEFQRSHLQRHSGGYTRWRDSALEAGRIRN